MTGSTHPTAARVPKQPRNRSGFYGVLQRQMLFLYTTGLRSQDRHSAPVSDVQAFFVLSTFCQRNDRQV